MKTVVQGLNEIANALGDTNPDEITTVNKGLSAINVALGGDSLGEITVSQALEEIAKNASGGGGGGDLAQFTVANGTVEFTWFGDEEQGMYIHELSQDAYNFLVDNFDEDRDDTWVGFYYRMDNSYGVYTTALEKVGDEYVLEDGSLMFYFGATPQIPQISPSYIMYQDQKYDDTITVPLWAIIYFGK